MLEFPVYFLEELGTDVVLWGMFVPNLGYLKSEVEIPRGSARRLHGLLVGMTHA